MDYHSCHDACYDLVQVDELKAKGETDAVIESTAEGFSTCRFLWIFYGKHWVIYTWYIYIYNTYIYYILYIYIYPTIVGFAETWVFWIFVG